MLADAFNLNKSLLGIETMIDRIPINHSLTKCTYCKLLYISAIFFFTH
ncbi:hypothetical protein OSCI_3960028 [Kamptonema sp. PCC 6506]|nr:hypothetical protein OSCI_3960028 [Kamptonema sp. PCC 6506]